MGTLLVLQIKYLVVPSSTGVPSTGSIEKRSGGNSPAPENSKENNFYFYMFITVEVYTNVPTLLSTEPVSYYFMRVQLPTKPTESRIVVK